VISHDLHCILVHIQKTGGNSIRHALGMALIDPHKHRSAFELRHIYGVDIWQSYFRFGFVRNPWDRLVSWWEMIQRNAAQGRPMNGFQRYVLERARTFEEFIHNCNDDYPDADGSKWIFRNQVDYLTDANGTVMVDYVGQFERLHADFAIVANRLGLGNVSIPHVNRSVHAPYTEYYSPQLRDVVGERYSRDIAAFDYRFG
jgi:hypothetical protein